MEIDIIQQAILQYDSVSWHCLKFACCRRGIRTAHGAVSRDTKFGGLPQSTRVPALYRVCPVVTTPETGGHGCQVSSSYSIKELHFGNLLTRRCFRVN